MRLARSTVAVVMLALPLLAGCETGEVRVSIAITDELWPTGDHLTRTVKLTLPAGEEGDSATRNILAQARKEGWEADSRPVQEGEESRICISASRLFATSSNSYAATFTKLFGPYYRIDEREGGYSITGRLFGRGIKAALDTEAAKAAMRSGYSRDAALRYVSVSIVYPVNWEIICDGDAVRGSPGTTVQGRRVMLAMDQNAFLSHAPLSVHWEPRSHLSFSLVLVIGGLLLLTGGYWYPALMRLSSRTRGAYDAYRESCIERHSEIEATRKAHEVALSAYDRNTGRGQCPACGSCNIEHFRTGGADTDAQVAYGCCMVTFFLWPLALLAPYLFKQPEQHHARCGACGNQWLI